MRTAAEMNRKMVDADYSLVGYAVYRLTSTEGDINFGSYELSLYEGPIFIEERLKEKKLPYKLKVTISRLERHVPQVEPPVQIKPKKK